MLIGFDASQTGAGKAGCGYMAWGLLNALAAAEWENNYLVYPEFGDFYHDWRWRRTVKVPAAGNFRRHVPVGGYERNVRFWAAAQAGCADPDLVLGRPDVIHANNYFCPSGLRYARLVYTLHDLSFLDQPECLAEANRQGCLQNVFRAAGAADLILGVSAFTLARFRHYFPAYPAERLRVLPLASRFAESDQGRRPRRLRMPPGEFLLCPGTLEPRKNQARLLTALGEIKRTTGACPPLVLAGGMPKGGPDWSRLATEAGLTPEEAVFLGYVSDAELLWLYDHCRLLVYPSLYEGFGLPVLEAFGRGAPVICGRGSSLTELAGDAARLVDPINTDDLALTVRELWADEPARRELAERGRRRARDFSWARTAELASTAYAEAAARPAFAAGSTLRPST